MNNDANMCACGCSKMPNVGKRFVNHHHRIGRIVSLETREKISRKLLRNKNGSSNKGKHRSNESKEKMSATAKSYIHSKHTEETKRKIGLASRGRIVSEETRQKISNAKKGGVPWNKGTHIDNGGGKWRKGHIPWNLGKPHSKESIAKIMVTNGYRKFLYLGKDGAAIKMRSPWEVKYAQYLDSCNYIWKYEPRDFLLSNGKRYFPDFFVETLNEWHEVKGFLRNLAKMKIELFKTEYPDIKFIVLFYEDLIKLGTGITK